MLFGGERMLAIVDSRITDTMRRSLMREGFSLIELPSFSALGEAISSHPDTLFFRLGKSIISSVDYAEYAPYIFTDIRDGAPDFRIILTDDRLGDKYPEDCKYNAQVMGDIIFCRESSISDAVSALAKAAGKRIVNVKQGYPACSTLALGERAAITADKGISRALRAEGIKVYEIEPGNIALPPHKYGFIGGACGVFRDKIYFFGDYTKHPSRDILDAAMETWGFSPVCLSGERLVDLGGILFLD